MKTIILLLAACATWGQPNIVVQWGASSATTGASTVVANDANDNYVMSFVPAAASTSVTGVSVYSSARATANVDALTVEIFKYLAATPGVVVTYTDASDIVTYTNNSLANGDRVKFSTATTLPAGINIDTVYYVCNRAANNFQIDDDAGCASIVTDFSGSAGAQYAMQWIASSTTFTPSPVTAVTWIDFSTFSSHTLTAGDRYVAIFRNTEAVPATDSVTLQFVANTTVLAAGEVPSMNMFWAGGGVGTTFGTTIARGAATAVSTRTTGYVGLSNGELYGTSIYDAAVGTNSRVNGTREVGVKFTTPSNIKYNVAGIGTQMRAIAGTTYPTQFTLKLYSVGGGTDTLIDSCDAGRLASNTTTAVSDLSCTFSAAQALSASSTYRVIVSAKSGVGDGSNYANMTEFTSRSGVTFQTPLSIAFTYCAATCTTTANWTDDATKSVPFAMFLDQTTPYASQGSGTGGAFVVAQ